MENISTKFTHLFKVISSQRFLRMEALGGEIPFFIAAYEVQQTQEVEKAIKALIKKLGTAGVPVLELNLFDIAIELLEEELGMEELQQIELDMDKEEFKDALQSVLDIQEVFMPRIKEKIDASTAKVYFLTGVGMVFPFMRAHNLLNNLQNVAKDAPTVTFFPGAYNGNALNLFNVMQNDNYYRAFNIENIETKQL